MYKVFIDGKEGTTGLQIYERLEKRADIELLLLPEEKRKDLSARKEMINKADVVFLCLPDAAARESVSLCENPKTKIIDASTAHRTADGWAYGFPELSPEFKAAIASSNRIANPGCHASGFIALVYPLVKSGLVPADYPFVAHSITGYSGGGKKMIAEYESAERSTLLDSPRQYGLTLTHKHLPEMTKVCALTSAPIFNPIVGDFYSGMCVTVPLFTKLTGKNLTPNSLKEFYTEYYKGAKFLSVGDSENGFLAANVLSGTNKMELFIGGNEEQILLSARFDNLGKGASGAAVQNMNVALGLEEDAYLN
ncbi:MAG: N-acetyl-gamma-glutamyl-phosphate reductase [Clostridia bacterium]|nr:N-acetyl-gamma-glutamyl-phosphate reductase [Clostridia bacterium]